MKRFWYPLFAVVIAGVIYYFNQPEPLAPVVEVPIITSPASPESDSQGISPSPNNDRPTLAPAPPKLGPRTFYGELPPNVRKVKDLVMVNTPSPEWQSRLRAHLVRSGGEQLKSVELEPQESYIIMEGVEARNVERVVVTVRAKDGRMTRFFAEVDSESGHVTKSWGGTIHEKTALEH